MSKKTFTFFIIVLIAIMAFLAWFFFLRTTDQTGPDTNNQPTDLFPFGQGSTTPNTTEPQTGTTTGQIDISNGSSQQIPRFRQLWREPNAGAVFFPGTGTTTGVRFIDRATGHAYESPLLSTGETKISNVTIPQIHEALWADNGTELVFRYLKDDSSIQSFYGAISTSSAATTSSAIEGYFLPTDIRDISIAGDKILYFNPSVQIGSLVQSRIDGTGRRVVMSSDARDWSVLTTNQKTAFLNTRPSGAVKGFGYALDLATGSMSKIAGDILGLTGTINPTATWALMSAQERGGIVSASYDLTKKTMSTILIKTLSDKCAWSNTKNSLVYCAVPINIPSGTYPDDWYQGETSFSDKLISIDLSTGETELVVDPSFDAAQDMDIMKIVVDRTDSHITFTNKKDMSLWLYRLTDN